MPVVYTGGTFDLFHAGHVDLLEYCRWLSGPNGSVVVSLNTDDFIARYKGKPPVMSYEERKSVLQACKYVDLVVSNNGAEDSKPTILKHRPLFLVVGSDWARKDYYAQMQFSQDWLDEQGISLVYVPRTRVLSTTQIKERTC